MRDELLKRRSNQNEGRKIKKTRYGIPWRSYPYIQECVFSASIHGPGDGTTPIGKDKDGMSQLLVCQGCNVCVHACKLLFIALKQYSQCLHSANTCIMCVSESVTESTFLVNTLQATVFAVRAPLFNIYLCWGILND